MVQCIIVNTLYVGSCYVYRMMQM